jgi:hypothetical protein
MEWLHLPIPDVSTPDPQFEAGWPAVSDFGLVSIRAKTSLSIVVAASAARAADSGDLERSIRSFVNTESGDHEHLLAWA